MGEFIPALRFPALTAWYDKVIARTTREEIWRNRLLSLLRLEDCDSVLDIGCGTGSLTVAMHAIAPSARIVGIDADQDALAIARAKLTQISPGIQLHQGLAQHLPFPDGAFDAVVSSLFFHHLRSEDKRSVLRQARRVLRPAGRLAIADWGAPTGPFARTAFLAVQLLDGFESTADSVRGVLPQLIEASGFDSVKEAEPLRTALGTMRFWTAVAAGE
jgi:ubiquinone/menaquinone biosynthesis C-methylase UbiE